MIVDHHGLTVWMVPVNLRSSCFINVERFPFDVQTCNFSFVSWTHNKRQMDFKVMLHEPSLTDGYLNSSLWTIRDITTRRVEVNYPCCPTPYVNIVTSLTIQRKPLYYVSNIVVRSLFLFLLSLILYLQIKNVFQRRNSEERR